MSNKEENIDRFVKKVISHYDVKYDDAHWDALEKQLDAEMPIVATTAGTPLNIPVILISVVGGMVLMLGILWMGGTFDEEVGSVVENNDRSIENRILPESQENELQFAEKESGSTSSNNNVIADQSSSREIIRAKGKDNISNEDLDSSDDIKALSFAGTTSHDRAMILGEDPDSEIYENDLSSGQHFMVVQPPFILYSHDIPVAQYDILVAPDQVEYASANALEEVMDDVVVPEKGKLFTYGVALGVSPDFNSVGMKESKELSGQAGIQLMATFRDRLSLSTGAYYGKKKFITSGENYFPPNEYWKKYTNGVVPEWVDGHIVVLDVPINLTYNWNPRNRIQFISSIGVSSYFILSEDCTYKFSNYNPGTEYGWDTDEMTKELFGAGNLSLGVLWYLKPRINIRVEPYIKVPLKDVGWGSVDLYSAGSLISVQYTFN